MNKKYLDSKKGSLEEVSTKIAIEQPSIDRTFKSETKLTTERKYFGTKPMAMQILQTNTYTKEEKQSLKILKKK